MIAKAPKGIALRTRVDGKRLYVNNSISPCVLVIDIPLSVLFLDDRLVISALELFGRFPVNERANNIKVNACKFAISMRLAPGGLERFWRESSS